jgi:hypothetical protein
MSEKTSAVNKAVNFLNDENTGLLSFNADTIANIEPSEKVESVKFVNTGFGKWEEQKTVLDNPVKKDRDQKSSEVNILEDQISTYTELAQKIDRNIFNTITEITNKKAQIISIINTAVGAGCSVIGTATSATINGVAIGIGSDVYDDTGIASRYPRLENFQDKAFSQTTSQDLSESNLGRGYKTEFKINNQDRFVQNILQIQPAGHLIFPVDLTTQCLDYLSQVQTLASEIGQLRTQLSSSDVSDVNKVKTRKTEKEMFIYGYRRPEKYFSEREGENNSLSGTIQSNQRFSQ